MKTDSNILSKIFKGFLILQLICVVALVASCSQQEKEKRDHDLNDFKAYVKAHKDSVDEYANKNWDELNNDFEKKKADMDKEAEKMDEDARNSYNKAVNEWAAFKNEYERKREQNAKVAQMDNLRATLVIDGVRPDYTDLNAADVLKAYEHFVDAVKTNKDSYTKEQWTVINVNYKALNGRKRELEKTIPAGHMGKILKLQLEYTGIKAINRPFADNA